MEAAAGRHARSLFEWARLSYEGVTNPFEGAAFNIKSDQRDEKDPFLLEDLKAIVGLAARCVALARSCELALAPLP